MSRPILVDADVLVYWTSFACQKTRYIYNDHHFEDHKKLREHLALSELKPKDVEFEKYIDVLDDNQFYIICDKVLEMIREDTMSSNLELYVSGDTNFRNDIATLKKYKGNRTADKPLKYGLARDYWLSKAFKVSSNQEADDDMAIRQVELNYEGVIATIDKDLNMIPGRHFNWQKEKGQGRLYKVDPDNADRWFWTQMLTGDTADNIPGIKRCGEKTAEKLLDGLDTDGRMNVVLGKYREQYGKTADEALTEIGRLLWMRRQPEQMWTFDNHKEFSGL